MRDDFDKKLFEMAKNSKVKEPYSLRFKVNSTCKTLKKRRFNIKPVASIAVILAFCFVTLSICSPTYASNIPILNGITEFLSNKFNLNGYTTNSTELNYVVSNNDYTLTLESAYYDGIETTVFFTIKGNEKLDLNKQYYFEVDLKYKDEISYEYSVENGEFIDEYTFAGMMIFYINPNNSNKLPEEFNLELTIPNIVIGEELNAINSKTLNLKFDIKDLKIDKLEVNKEVLYNENSIFFNNIKKYPTSLILNLNQKNPNATSNLVFIPWHEKQGPLKFSAGYDDGNNNTNYKYFLPNEEGKIYLIPVSRNTVYSESPIKKSINLKTGETMNLGSDGTISVENVEIKDDKTFLTVRTVGYASIYDLNIIDKNNPNTSIKAIKKDVKTLDLLDTLTTYIIPNTSDYTLEYEYLPDGNIEILRDQVIEVDFYDSNN